MIVTPIKTHKVTKKDTSLEKILDQYLKEFPDKSVLAVTSKIVSICEGRVVPVDQAGKDELIQKECERYIPREYNSYGLCLTITNNMLVVASGIDESNADGHYVLWPKDPQESANRIRSYLVNRFKVQNAGVVIVDSRSNFLRWGITGMAIAHSGFAALKNYIGTKDLFGRIMKISQQSVSDGLAASSSLVMGEGNESTPLAVITDAPFVEFQHRNPMPEELNAIKMTPEEDMYGMLYKSAPWKKGKKS